MAKQTWESCIYMQRKSVILSKLGPTLKNAGLGDKKLPFGIIIEICYLRGQVQLDDPQASKYVWGFHWYESWSGGDPMFDNVGKVHEMYPDKNLLLLKDV
jgi:glucosylceramidase